MTLDASQHSRARPIPLKVYRSRERLTVAAPMAGLEPEDISVEITSDGRLILRGNLRAVLKGQNEILLDEWSIGGYSREFRLPCPVDGRIGNVTYGNGVLVVALPITSQTQPGRLTLDVIGEARGEHAGNQGHPVRAMSNAVHRSEVHPGSSADQLRPGAEPGEPNRETIALTAISER
jgi:HSP20 family protein